MEGHNVSGSYKNVDGGVDADDFDGQLPFMAISAFDNNGNGSSMLTREMLEAVVRQWGKENNFDPFTQVSTTTTTCLLYTSPSPRDS